MKLIGSVLVAFYILSIPAYHDAQEIKHRDKKFGAALQKAIELFTEYHLPNAQARPKGFDLDAHLRKLEKERKKTTQIFHNDKGLRFLTGQLHREKDDLTILTILQIMAESKNPLGVPILEDYCKNGAEVISRDACGYLGKK
jgi:hypothetical protein